MNSKKYNSDMTQNQINEYNLMKVIATVLVVVGHSLYISFGGVNYSFVLGEILKSRVGQIMEIIAGIIYIFHMPLFFAVSGAVYYVQKNYYHNYNNLDEIILKKTKRLLIPYILSGILYVIPIKVISRYYAINYVHKAVFYEMLNGIGHLWFLIALFWFFIIFYVLDKYIYSKNKFIFWLIVLSTYFFSNIIDEFMPNGLKMNIKYLIFFCIGYFFEKIRKEYNKIKYMNVVTIIMCILAYVLYYNEVNVQFKYTQNVLFLILQCILILIVYNISYLSIKYFNVVDRKIYKILYKYNFQIYLFHDPLNYLILYVVSLFVVNITNIDIIRSVIFSFILIIILRILFNIYSCICIANIIKRLKIGIGLRNRLLYLCFSLFLLSFLQVAYNNYKGIGIMNEVYTPKLNNYIISANLTDENWENGILNGGDILLLDNSDFNKNILKNAKALKSNNISKEIVNIYEKDSKWIYIELNDRENIQEFRYPNNIKIIKSNN